MSIKSTQSAGGAGGVQAEKRVSPAPQKPSIYAGYSPIRGMGAGGAGGSGYLLGKKERLEKGVRK